MGRFEAGYAEGNVEPLLQNAPDFEDEAESADYISPVNPLFPTLSRPNRILSKHGKHPNVRSSGVPGGWGLYRRDWFHTICESLISTTLDAPFRPQLGSPELPPPTRTVTNVSSQVT